MLPPVLVVLALSTVFLFGNDRGHFYRDKPHHDWITSFHLTLALNLSPEHDFLGYTDRTLNPDGDVTYMTYVRYPIGTYLLANLVTRPFADDFSHRLYAARVVQLLLFVASGLLAWLTMRRLFLDRWGAVAATLLAFSSYYLLYYNDAFAPELTPALFGLLLAFHGMAVFVQEGRLGQLLAKACVGLFLYWHVYALLLPFVVLGFVREVAGGRPEPPSASGLRRWWTMLRGSRHLRLGAITLLWGSALLAFNVASEYRGHGGALALSELPTFVSLRQKLLDPTYAEGRLDHLLTWGAFLEQQFHRIGGMGLPLALNPFEYRPFSGAESEATWLPLTVAGGVLVAVCLAGAVFSRHRILLTSLVLTGFLWSLPFKRSIAEHEFFAICYVGVPLVFFSLGLSCARRLSRYVTPVLAAAALPVFVSSAFEMARTGQPPDVAAREAEMMDDYYEIRDRVGSGVVHIPSVLTDARFGGAPLAHSYFLAGTGAVTEYKNDSPEPPPVYRARRDLAEFLLLPRREDTPALLTPDNRQMFLYDRERYDRERYGVDGLVGPIIESTYDVYLDDRRLLYVDDSCANLDAAFFLHIFPAQADDLPVGRGASGFANRDFRFLDAGARTGDGCVAIRPLPEYPVRRIVTGQYIDDGRLWEAEYEFDASDR